MTMSVHSCAVICSDETSRSNSAVNNCVVYAVVENGVCSRRAQSQHENLEPGVLKGTPT